MTAFDFKRYLIQTAEDLDLSSEEEVIDYIFLHYNAFSPKFLFDLELWLGNRDSQKPKVL